MSRRTWTESEREVLRQRYPTEGALPLSIFLERSSFSIGSEARRLGLRSSGHYERGAKTLSESNESVNINYFDGDWTPNQAYIGGYIWADGSISQGNYAINFRCKDTDQDLILAMRTELQSNHKVSHRDRTFSANGIVSGAATSFSISSKFLCEKAIEKFGFEQSKSKLDLDFPKIPKGFLSHFCRGYLDGDGSVASTRNCIYWKGSPKFITTLQEVLSKELNLPKNPLVSDGVVISANWYHPQHLVDLYSWLYPEGKYLFGERKKEVLKKRIEGKKGGDWNKMIIPWNGEIRKRAYRGLPILIDKCIYCGAPREWIASAGSTRQGRKRIKCNFCGQKYIEDAEIPVLLKQRVAK